MSRHDWKINDWDVKPQSKQSYRPSYCALPGMEDNIIQLLVFEETNIKIYRCVKADIVRHEATDELGSLGQLSKILLA